MICIIIVQKKKIEIIIGKKPMKIHLVYGVALRNFNYSEALKNIKTNFNFLNSLIFIAFK